MKAIDILALVLVAAVAIGGKLFVGGNGDTVPHDRRPNPRAFAPGHAVPAPAYPDEPTIVVTIEEKRQSSTGTAFSVNRSGIWITARHVTGGCDTVALQLQDGRAVRVRRVDPHTFADISVLWTRGGVPALPLARPRPRKGQDGYSFGFPKGLPGDVHGQVIGRARMLSQGRYRTAEPVIAWAHVRRIPDRGPYLGGISGGPWLNSDGEVIGVHVAGAKRRGRSFSTTLDTLSRALGESGVRPAAEPRTLPPLSRLSPAGFAGYGDALRQRATVAKVLCLVGERWRRRA